MEPSGISFFTQQILYQTPTLLAAMLGVVLSLIFIRRYKLPAFLALLGCGTVIISSLIVTIAQAYFFSARLSSFIPANQSYAVISNVLAWIGALAKGLSIALLVVSVFIGRRATTALET